MKDQFKEAFDLLTPQQQRDLKSIADGYQTQEELVRNWSGIQLAKRIGYGDLNDNLFKALHYIFQQRKK